MKYSYYCFRALGRYCYWRYVAVIALLFLLYACGGGSDLSGLLSGSGTEDETSGSLSDDYGLTATVEANRVNLSWNLDSSASGYEVYRYTDSNCGSIPDSYEDCADAKFWSVSNNSLSDSGLSSNSIYYYRIRSTSSAQTGDLSNQLEALTLPDAASGFSATVEEGKPLLSWGEQNGTTYNLYRYSNQTCDISAIDLCSDRKIWSLSDTSQPDSSADGGELYYYQVEVVNSSGTSEISSQLEFLVPPGTPNRPSKFDLGDGSFSFDWNDVSGAEYYELFRYTESECEDIPDNYQNCPGAFSFTIDAEEDGSSYIDYLPEEGITYYYKLSAANSTGRSEPTDEFWASIGITLTQPIVDTPVASGQSVSLSWEPVDKASSYQVYASLQANCLNIPNSPDNCEGYTLFEANSTSNEVTGTSVTYNDLQVGSTYYFRVRATAGSVVSALSDEVNATTIPATPQVLTASGSVQQVNLVWDAVAGAQLYVLWAHSDPSCLDSIINSQDIVANCDQYSVFADLDALEYSHAGLDYGTTYYYYLSAENAAGVSAISTPAVSAITEPQAPQLLQAESNTSAISLSWESNLTGVDYYQLYRYTNQGCADDLVLSFDCDNDSTNWPQIDSSLSSIVDTQAQPGVVYYYRLAAVNNSGTSLSAEISIALQLPAPQQLVIEAGQNQLNLTWAAVIGAETYQLYRYSGACPALPDNDSVCSNYYYTELGADTVEFIDTGVVAGTSYSYQIAASITSAQDSELSAVASAFPLLLTPSISASAIAGGVELSFAAVPGAESYLLYRYLSSGCMLSEFTVATDCGDDNYQRITLDHAELSTSSDALQYQDTGLLGGTAYHYRLVATNANVANSDLSNEASAAALLTQPSILSSSGGYGSASIEWGTVLGADSYIIYQYIANGSNCYPQNLEADPGQVCTEGYAEHLVEALANNNDPDTNYTSTIADLDGDLSYGFRIQAQLTSFSPGELSDSVILAVSLPAPAELIVTAANNSADVSWQPVTNAVAYHLVRSTSAACLGIDDHAACADFVEYNLSDTSSHTDGDLAAGTAYYYRVRALAADGGAGAYSQEASAIPTLSAPVITQAVPGFGSVELSWDAVAGAEQYRVYTYDQQPCTFILSTGSDCGNFKVETNSSINSHTSKSLVGKQIYYFRVLAQRADQGDSELSEEISATPDVGVAVPSASVIENNITVSWEAVVGIEEYNLHRSTGADCFASVDPADYSANTDLCPNYEIWPQLNALSVSESVDLGLTYYYTTQSIDGDINSSISAPTSAVPLAEPVWQALQGGFAEIDLSWQADSSGAESHTLYRSAEADCQQQLADWAQCQQGAIFSNLTTGSYTDSGLQDGTLYYYILQANNYSGYATNITTQSVVTTPAAPTQLDLSFNESGVNVNWDANQSGVDSFTLYRYTEQDCSTILTDFLACGVDEADTKFWTDAAPPLLDAAADLEPGTVYYYTLAAENSSGGSLSAEYSIVTGAEAPTIAGVIGGYNSNEISWDPVLGATSYNLFRYTESACAEADIAAESEACGAVKITDVSSPYTDPPSGSSVTANLASSTYYYYRLTSINESATSALSDPSSGLTLPAAPSGLTAIGGDKSVTLEYSSGDSNLLSFIFSRDTTSECDLDDGTDICPNLLQLDGNEATSYIDNYNLESGKTYYYNAYAVNNTGRSRPSSDAEVITFPETPSDFSAAASSISQINLSWSRTTGTDKYLITRYLNPACDVDDLEQNLSSCGSDSEDAEVIEVFDGPSSPSYADSGLTPNTYYYYRIQASNASGNSDYSSPALTALPSPSRPAGFVAIGGNEEVNLSWDPVENASQYYLYRYTDSGCSSYESDIDSCTDGLMQQLNPETDNQEPLSFYKDTSGIDNSSKYYYRLQALNISGSSVITDEIESLTYPANPEQIDISVTSSRISLVWSLEDNIDYYELYRYTNSQCADIPGDTYEQCDNSAYYFLTYPNNSRTDTSLDHGSSYYYKLFSYNSSGVNSSEQLVAFTAPDSPSNIVATPIVSLTGGMELVWDSDEVGVGSYSVYRYQPAGCLNSVTLDSSDCVQDSLHTSHGLTSREFEDTINLKTGEQYSYLVAAVSSQSEAYSLSSEVSNYTYPAPPPITELEAEAEEVTINFEANQTGASSYYIYRYSGPPGCVEPEGVVSNCNHLAEYPSVAQSGLMDEGLDSGTMYYYRIASNNVNGTGYFSDEYTVTTLPAQPTNIDLVATADGVNVSWDNDQQGADSFILHRYRNSGCLAQSANGSNCIQYLQLDTQEANITTGEYSDTGLDYGYEYFYRLQAANDSGTGVLSNEFSVYTLPPAPNAPELQGGNNQIQITYDRTTLSATSYQLYRYTVSDCQYIGTVQFSSNCGDTSFWQDFQTGNSNSIIDNNLNSGTTYYYILTASNDSGEGLPSAEVNTTTVPDATSITQILGYQNRIQVHFDDQIDSATSYTLYRYSISGCFTSTTGDLCSTNIVVTAETSVSSPIDDIGLLNGTLYYYSLTSNNASGSSDYSAEASGITLPVTPSLDAVLGADGYMQIEFDSSITGASNYKVYRYASSNCIRTLEDYPDNQESCEAITIDGASSPIFDQPLDDGQTLYYRVASENASGSSELSAQDFNITYPPAADITTLEVSGDANSMTLSWDDDQAGVDNYTIYHYQNSGCPQSGSVTEASVFSSCSQLKSTSGDSPITFASLVPGTTYYLSIKSNNASGYKISDEFEVTTVPDQPAAVLLTGGNYQIEIDLDTATDSFSGASYFHLYRANTANCLSNDSLATCNSLQQLSDVSQLDDYALDYNDFPYTDANLEAGSTYYYFLQAANTLGTSLYSEQRSVITAPSAPTEITLTPGREQNTVQWSSPAGAEDIYVYRYTNSGCNTLTSDISLCTDSLRQEVGSGSFTDNPLEPGTVYYYVLEASNTSGSELSQEYSSLTYPASPAITQVTGGEQNIIIEFDDSVASALSFTVYRYLNDDDCIVENHEDYSLDFSQCSGLTTFPTASQPSIVSSPYTDTGLNSGVSYYYQLAAHNTSGASALTARAGAITLPALPTDITLTPGDGNITIDWDNDIIGNDPGTTLYRYVDQNCAASLEDIFSCDSSANMWLNLNPDDNPNQPPIVDIGLADSTTYYYALKIGNASGSIYSDELAALTYPAQPSAPRVTGANRQITIDWDSISGINTYTIYYYTAEDCSSFPDCGSSNYTKVERLASLGETYTVGNLDYGTTYYVNIEVHNDSGSSISEANSSITLTDKPEFAQLTGADKTINLSWTSPGDGVAEYDLIRYETSGCMTGDGDLSACASAELYAHNPMPSSTTSYTDTLSLSATQRYYYRLGARNASGTVWSDEASAVTAPEVITPVVISGSDHIEITWDIDSYKEVDTVTIYSTSQAGCGNAPPDYTKSLCLNWQSWTDETPTQNPVVEHIPDDPDLLYYYYLEANNTSGSSFSSAESGLMLAAAPVFTQLEGGDGQVDLAWEATSNANYYTLYSYLQSCPNPDSDSTTCGSYFTESNLTVNTAVVSGLDIGTTYYFRISVTNATGTSALSAEQSVITLPATPANLLATPGSNSITLSWGAAQGASDYYFYQYSDPDCADYIPAQYDQHDDCSITRKSVTGLITTDSNLIAGSTYYYRVTASNRSGESTSASSEVSAMPLLGAPDSPDITVDDSGGIVLSWVKVNGADSYEIYRYSYSNCLTDRAGYVNGDCTDGDLVVFTSASDTTEYTDSTTDGGSTYYYRVAALQQGISDGEFSDEVSATARLQKPVSLIADGGFGQVSLSWNAVAGADSYNLYRYSYSDCLNDFIAPAECQANDPQYFMSASIDASSTSYLDTGMDNLQFYYYRVSASSSDASVPDSLFSDQSSAYVQLTAPQNVQASSASLQIDISWDQVTTADSTEQVNYIVYRYTNDCDSPHDNTLKSACQALVSFTVDDGSLSYSDTAFTIGGDDYQYRVQAFVDTTVGDISEQVSAQPLLPAPLNPFVDPGSASLTLSWDPVDDATSYAVYRYSNQGCYTQPQLNSTNCNDFLETQADTTIYPDSGLDPTKTYYYVVAAQKTGATALGAYSTEVSAIPYLAQPDNLIVYASGQLEISVIWDPVAEADRYVIYHTTSADCEFSGFSSEPPACGSGSYSEQEVIAPSTSYAFTSLQKAQTYYYQVKAFKGEADESGHNYSTYSERKSALAFESAGITDLLGANKEINFTFDDFGTSQQLNIYRYTDPSCTTSALDTGGAVQCSLAGNSSDVSEWQFSGAIDSADYQINDPGLEDDTRYYYQLWSAATNEADDAGVWSERYSAMTWPAADVGTTLHYYPTETLGTQIVLSFAPPAVHDDNYYHFLRHTDLDCYTNYQAGTELNRSDYTDWSAFVNVSTADPCAGLAEVVINDANLHAPVDSQAELYEDTGLAEGTTYYYLMRVVNYSGVNGEDLITRSGASTTSNQISWTTVPPAPGANDLQFLASPAIGDDNISLKFEAQPGATSYKLVRYNSANCPVADSQIISVESCSSTAESEYQENNFIVPPSTFTDTDLAPGTEYTYRYRALNAAGSSEYSPEFTALTLPAKPEINIVASIDNSGADVISVNWQPADGVTHRRIYGTTKESCLKDALLESEISASIANCDDYIDREVIAGSANSADITVHSDTASTSIKSGTYYYFSVQASNATGVSEYSDIENNITAPASPNVITLTAGYQEIRAEWEVPTGSAENILYRYTSSGCSLTNFPTNCGTDTNSYTFAITDQTSSTFLVDTDASAGLADNTLYYYSVQATNVAGSRYTEFDSTASAYTAPSTPAELNVTAEGLSMHLSWSAVPTGADDKVADYEILRSSESDCYGNSPTRSYSHSDYTGCADAVIFTLTYGSSDYADVYQYTDDILDPTAATPEPLANGTNYYYWIRSFYSADDGSPVYSASTSAPESNITIPPAPANLSVDALDSISSGADGTQIDIEWDAVSGVATYYLYRTTSAGCITDANRNAANTQTNCTDYFKDVLGTNSSKNYDLPDNTIYYYYVSAVNSTGEGNLSTVVSAHTAPIAPEITSVTTTGKNSIEITYDDTEYDGTVAQATEYYFYAYTDNSDCDPMFDSCLNERNASSESSPLTFTGLTPGTQYYFKSAVQISYQQENGKTDTIWGYTSANSETNHTLANHPTIINHEQGGSSSLTLTYSIEGGYDDAEVVIYENSFSGCTIDDAVNNDDGNTCSSVTTYNTNMGGSLTNTYPLNNDNYNAAYFYITSSNPAGQLDLSSAAAIYEVLPLPQDIDATMSHDTYSATYDVIPLKITSAEAKPDNNTWTLHYYPNYVDDPTISSYIINPETDLIDSEPANGTFTYQVDLPLLQQYYLQPHWIDLNASTGGDYELRLDAHIGNNLAPPLVYPQTHSDSFASDTTFNYYFDIEGGSGNVEHIYDTYDLAPEFAMYISKNFSCLAAKYTHEEIEAACTETASLSDIKNYTKSDNYYYPHEISSDIEFGLDNTKAFYSSEDFSVLIPETGETFYYAALALSRYTMHFPDTSYTVTYSTSDYIFPTQVASFEYRSSMTSSVPPSAAPTLVLNPDLLSQHLHPSDIYNSWHLTLLWSALEGISAYDIHEYTDSDCAYLLQDPALCANHNLYTGTAPEFARAFSSDHMGKYFYYRLQVYDSAGNSSQLSDQIATHIPQALNDSGLNACAQSELLTGSQDCQVGRDFVVVPGAKVGSGSAGFDLNLSYSQSGSACIHDNTTGLSWSAWSQTITESIESNESADPLSAAPDLNLTTQVTFADLQALTSNDPCGHSDWAVPSIHELLSIADYNQTSAKIDVDIFTEFNLSQPTYWSASGHVLDFTTGAISLETNASATHSVMLTRSDRRWGTDFGPQRFQLLEHQDESNATIYLVYDNHTRLHYSPCLAGQSYDPATHSCIGLATELDYIDSLNAYDSNSTWRQPNIKELLSILDPNNNLQPNSEFFPAYPDAAQIFILTPSEQGADYLLGRHLNVASQSTQPTVFELLNSHLIYHQQ